MKKFHLLLAGILFTVPLFAAELVKEGNALAEIIIPEDALKIEKYAAEELSSHLEKISGAKLAVRTSPSDKAVQIRLGRAAKMPRIAFRSNEGMIRIYGNNIDIAGNDGTGDPLAFKVSSGTLFAVYDFLEKEFGVRWLWPGDLGTYTPKKSTLSVTDSEKFVKPLMNSSCWRLQRGMKNWSSEKVARQFLHDRTVWLRRHRFTSTENLAYGHAFTMYKKLYGKNNPDFFNLLPDNSRNSDPNYFGGNDQLVSMCVSNPALVKKIIDNWQKKNPDAIINLNENDTAGKCICPDCLAMDENNDPDRVKRASEKFFNRDKNWFRELGSLSERYAKFYLAVQKEADKINPDNKIIGCIYANYFEAPEKTKLNDRIIMRFCPPIMYPWTGEKVALFKKLWKGWRNAGVRLMHRPNYTLDGHNFPLLYYNEFAECFDFAVDNGLYASDMDSLTSVFGVNGITLYVIAAKHSQGKNKTVQDLENDYFTAFGNAAVAMRKFVKIMTKATQKYRDGGSDTIEGGVYSSFYTVAGKIFTPQVMQDGFAALNEAEKLAGNDETALKRIDFVRKGFEDCDLVLKVQEGFEKYQATGEADMFVKYLKQLNDFREKYEHYCYADKNTMVSMETRKWPRHLIMLGDNSFELKNWEIRFDPEQKGMKEKWFSSTDRSFWQGISTDAPWEKQSVGLEWEKKHGKHFKGFGWYRCNFDLKNVNPNQQMKLTFGAIDGAAEIWLNGKKIHSREFPFKGDGNSWRMPFEVDVTGKLVSGNNHLCVRVEKHLGVSGIWRPVFVSCGTVDAPSLNAKFKYNIQSGKINFKTGNYPLEMTAVSRGEKRAYGGIWGRLFRIEKVTPNVMYEFKATFSTDNEKVTFEPWLRSSNAPGLNQGNINIKATATSGQKKTLTARLIPDRNTCTIFLNITTAPGKITIHDIKFYPLITK